MEKQKGGAFGGGVTVAATRVIDSKSQLGGADCSSSGASNEGPNTSDRLLGRWHLLSRLRSLLLRNSIRFAFLLAAAFTFFGISDGRSRSFRLSYWKFGTSFSLIGWGGGGCDGNLLGVVDLFQGGACEPDGVDELKDGARKLSGLDLLKD